MEFCREIAGREPYPGENLASISACLKEQGERFSSIYAVFENKSENPA
jgi:hypothetical protein